MEQEYHGIYNSKTYRRHKEHGYPGICNFGTNMQGHERQISRDM
jgi:hypothetical protein